MNEDVPILTVLIGAGLTLYLGYEINRRRNRLRLIFNAFDKEESKIADVLEAMVKSGELRPFVHHAAPV